MDIEKFVDFIGNFVDLCNEKFALDTVKKYIEDHEQNDAEYRIEHLRIRSYESILTTWKVIIVDNVDTQYELTWEGRYGNVFMNIYKETNNVINYLHGGQKYD